MEYVPRMEALVNDYKISEWKPEEITWEDLGEGGSIILKRILSK
jgi:hypothetical protein